MWIEYWLGYEVNLEWNITVCRLTNQKKPADVGNVNWLLYKHIKIFEKTVKIYWIATTGHVHTRVKVQHKAMYHVQSTGTTHIQYQGA